MSLDDSTLSSSKRRRKESHPNSVESISTNETINVLFTMNQTSNKKSRKSENLENTVDKRIEMSYQLFLPEESISSSESPKKKQFPHKPQNIMIQNEKTIENKDQTEIQQFIDMKLSNENEECSSDDNLIENSAFELLLPIENNYVPSLSQLQQQSQKQQQESQKEGILEATKISTQAQMQIQSKEQKQFSQPKLILSYDGEDEENEQSFKETNQTGKKREQTFQSIVYSTQSINESKVNLEQPQVETKTSDLFVSFLPEHLKEKSNVILSPPCSTESISPRKLHIPNCNCEICSRPSQIIHSTSLDSKQPSLGVQQQQQQQHEQQNERQNLNESKAEKSFLSNQTIIPSVGYPKQDQGLVVALSTEIKQNTNATKTEETNQLSIKQECSESQHGNFEPLLTCATLKPLDRQILFDSKQLDFDRNEKHEEDENENLILLNENDIDAYASLELFGACSCSVPSDLEADKTNYETVLKKNGEENNLKNTNEQKPQNLKTRNYFSSSSDNQQWPCPFKNIDSPKKVTPSPQKSGN
jgi:hypothetical protein